MAFPFRIPAVLFALALAWGASASPRPDVVLILSDDMGFSDLGCYGGEIPTPHLDALAAGGVRFTQFYNVARCCPTRAALLTGRHPHQAGIGHMQEDLGWAAYRGQLSHAVPTLPEVLRPAGYRTYMAGKWHVAGHPTPDGPRDNWPRQRGFDRFYGTLTGAGSFYDPTSLCRDNDWITPENDPDYRPETFYYTDALTDNAVAFIREHQRNTPGQSYFLYLAYTAAHWPMHALPGDIDAQKGRYDAGYDAVRQRRLERARGMGILSPGWDLSPTAGNWTNVSHRAWETRCMEVYAAMVSRMDAGIGRLVAELRNLGRLDNTLILFLQDNGGCAEGLGRQSNAAEVSKASYRPLGPDTLQDRIWPPMQTRDGRPVRTGPETMPGGPDTYVAYGRAWANVSNTPFREYKHWVHEGGISTPLIVHWPDGIDASRRGTLEHQPGHLTDLMATVLDVSGVSLPRVFADAPTPPLEGISLRPAWDGQPLARELPLAWEHEGNRALRDGNWKIVSRHAGDQPGPWELYNMTADRTELHNRADAEPLRVRTMAARWTNWAARVGVQPWPVKPPRP